MILISLYKYLAAYTPQLCKAIYPYPLPQQHPLPAISLEDDGASETQLLDSSVQSLKQNLVTILCWDASSLVANQLANRVHDALVGYTGAFGDVDVRLIAQETRTGGPENETGLLSVQMQFLISYI